MRCWLSITLLTSILAGGVAVLWLPLSRTAQPAVKDLLTLPPSPPLPISQVILFSSGVGYFQREGEISGDSQVELALPAKDVNDLLKSLVLQDAGGGKVTSVTYDNQDPIEKTLQSFALDLTYNPTFGELLNQARGEKIEVTLQTPGSSAGSLTGIIVGMESDPLPPAGNATTGANTSMNPSTDFLNLLSPDGLKRIPLGRIERVRFTNAALQNEFDAALALLATAHDTQKKQIRLHFAGDGKRKVRVGYVVDNPIWKTSYRLALDAAGKAFLQGWALVENVGDDDWKNVRMVLVSGRPISYQMDLYSPLYVPRPIVEPELFASLRPPNYTGPLIAEAPGRMGMAGVPGGGPTGFAGFGGQGQGLGLGGLGGGGLGLGGLGQGLGIGGLGLGGGGFQGVAGGMANLGNLGGFPGNRYQNRTPQAFQKRNNNPEEEDEPQPGRLSYQELQKRREQQKGARDSAKRVGSSLAGVDFKEGVESVASAEEIGDHFQYAIDHQVTLARRKSAMIPIVNKDVQVSRVSIFNPAVHAKFPLLGMRFTNSTDFHLMQGPITVYEAGGYAGDSRLADLQPHEERLLAFAVDLGTEVKVEEKTQPTRTIAVKIVKGVLELTSKNRETKSYLIRNRSLHDRVLLIEQPVRADWKLVAPEKPAEQSRDVYRFEVKVPAGRFQRHEVTEDHESIRMTALLNKEDKEIAVLLAEGPVSPEIRDALQKAKDLWSRLTEASRESSRLQEEGSVLWNDQARLRQDLQTVPANSPIHRRYLEKFDKQESQIETLQEQLKKQRELQQKYRKEYEDYVSGLNVG
jgi:hypothetical protein